MAYNEKHWEKMGDHLTVLKKQIEASPIMYRLATYDWYSIRLNFLFEQNRIDLAIVHAQKYLDYSEVNAFTRGVYETYST